MAGRRRPRAESQGGAGYDPKSGPFAGQHFGSYYAYRDARARRAGYEGYSDQEAQRKETEQVLGHKAHYSKRFRDNPIGEEALNRAKREGKLGSIARRQGNKTAQDQHRRNVDFAILDLQVLRPDFVIEEDFWNS